MVAIWMRNAYVAERGDTPLTPEQMKEQEEAEKPGDAKETDKPAEAKEPEIPEEVNKVEDPGETK